MRALVILTLVVANACAVVSHRAFAAPPPPDASALPLRGGQPIVLDPLDPQQEAQEQKPRKGIGKKGRTAQKRTGTAERPGEIRAWSQANGLPDTAVVEPALPIRRHLKAAPTNGDLRATLASAETETLQHNTDAYRLRGTSIGDFGPKKFAMPRKLDGSKLPAIAEKALRPLAPRTNGGLPTTQVIAGAAAVLAFMLLREYLAYARRWKIRSDQAAARLSMG